MFVAFVLATLLVWSHAAPVAKSPCQERFEYGKSDVAGQWNGVLNLQADYKLYGTWIRLIFDTPVKSVEVEGDSLLQAVRYDEEPKNEVLLKNRDFIIQKGALIKIPFVVNYEGKTAPNLVGYRLNGRDICPGLE